MTTDDYVRLGFHRFMADYHDELNRTFPQTTLSTDPIGVQLETERRSIERRFHERRNHAQTRTTGEATDTSTADS